MSEAYLSDASGRVVTPRIVPRAANARLDDQAALAARQRELAAQRISRLTGTRLENEKLLQQLEERKRIVGPGLDRGGCTFANDARRRGFYDDEDFVDVLVGDEIDEVGSDWEVDGK